LIASDQRLGPSENSSDPVTFDVAGLQEGTTYYWKIVSKTMANVTREGPIWSFRTSGAPPPSSLPEGWQSQDIGSVGIVGSAAASDGTFTVRGAGADVWGTNDALHYAYRSLSGDGTITARVASVDGSQAWAKVGVMIRSTTASNAAHAFMLVSSTKGLAFQRRTSSGATSAGTSGGAGAAPQWVRLTRAGNTITAFVSADGATWTTVGSDTFSMPATVLAGLAVSSHTTSGLATGLFDNVSVDGGGATPPPPTLPEGWQSQDVGSVGRQGMAEESGGFFTVRGAGADVWGSADAFRYAYRPFSGDGTITARVASAAGSEAWTKVGVMIRGSTSSNAAHAFMLVSTGKGLAFQRRTTAGGLSTNTSGGAGTAPRWVRLTRAGNTISAFISTDGANWTPVGSDTFAMPVDVLAGLAVSSHTSSTLATAGFDNVAIETGTPAPSPPPPSLPAGWQAGDIGEVGTAGSAGASGGVFTVSGAGEDVWGTADAFHYAYHPLSGDGAIAARVASVSGSEAWTKVGVMIRASTAPNAAHAFMLVSTGKGLAFQRRIADGTISTNTSGGAGVAPAWVRLTRSGNSVTAFVSTDGVGWTLVGSDTISLPADALVGLAVSSHDSSRLATGLFDNVTIS
jgi:regulation of enolase protein 1 (concanavalin A-like superfamily)